MVRSLLTVASAFFLLSSSVSAAGTKCGGGSKCPESLPCCSQYGECGLGAYCLGGCDPLNSNSLDSCMPAPVCKSQDFKMNSLDGLMSNTEYLGDSSKTDWVYSGEPKKYNDNNGDQVLLTMPEHSVGTLLASTTYVWYGKISAKLKTSRGKGVVSAFILLSDVKDEIDFEFVGVDLNAAQSNYYFQGITDYTHGANHSVSKDTFSNYHTYEIDWTPEQIKWSLDGNEVRTVKKSDTYNATKKRYDYPQTPARVQLSLWPAGLSTNGEGTVEWAGGLIDWDSQDIKNAHYYYAMVQDISIQCYDAPSDAKKSGSKSYVYTDNSGQQGAVEITNKNTALKSFLGSGQNPNAGEPSKPSGTSSSAGAKPTKTDAPTVPGLSGAGTGSNGQRGGGGDIVSDAGGSAETVSANLPQPSSGGNGGGSGGGNSGGGDNGGGDDFHGFSQGGDSGGNSSSGTGAASSVKGESVVQGSLFAVLLAIAALLVL